ncbi:hypothetical protein ES705_09407 [subsurface metagenome]
MTDSDLKAFYPKSHYRMMGHFAEPVPEPPERVDLDQPLFDELIAAGRTPEYAQEQAEHSAFVKRVYENSREKRAPDLPYEPPEEPEEPPEEMDQAVYDDLIARGHTEEEAKSEAEHAAWLARVRAESQPAPAAKPPEDDRDYSKIYPKSQ